MLRRRRKKRQSGLYAPLALALLCLLAALVLLAYRQAERSQGARSPGVRVETVRRGGKPVSGSISALKVALLDARGEALRQLPLEEYLIGVVAAEMPAGFAEQALEAQAVAARTRAAASMRALGGAGCARMAQADICSDSTHCQAWADEDALREKWGGDYAANRRKIADAVLATRGEVITFDGALIEVLYHASSGGVTEDVEHVFSQALPYLRGVDSPGEEGAKGYASAFRLSCAQAAGRLNDAFPKADVTADKLPGSLKIIERFDTGRVGKVQVGSAVVTGRELRQALGLSSTLFTLRFAGDELIVEQRGYGHGVGMSQVGADAMARAGSDHGAILRHYYTGVEIEHW